MKKTILLLLPFLFAALLVSCAHSVKRVSADTQVDLSGFWNDTDLRLASQSLIDDCMSSPRLASFSSSKGRLPVIIVGSFRNASDEHIDTSILSDKMETAILNSGKADFVASGELRNEIRAEREDQQQGYTSDDSIKALGKEKGADYIMTGTVKTIIDQYDKTTTRTYFVTAQLTDIETNMLAWKGENSDIKKIIKNAGVKP